MWRGGIVGAILEVGNRQVMACGATDSIIPSKKMKNTRIIALCRTLGPLSSERFRLYSSPANDHDWNLPASVKEKNV